VVSIAGALEDEELESLDSLFTITHEIACGVTSCAADALAATAVFCMLDVVNTACCERCLL
jgi:hypothetical protein